MVGIAGSGKTTIAKRWFPKHVKISLDGMPKSNRKTEHDLIKQHLDDGDNVIVDDTNLTKTIRSAHIELAKKYRARITAIFLDLPMWKIQEQNSKREKQVPESALFKMRKQLETPMEIEGIDFIQTIK